MATSRYVVRNDEVYEEIRNEMDKTKSKNEKRILKNLECCINDIFGILFFAPSQASKLYGALQHKKVPYAKTIDDILTFIKYLASLDDCDHLNFEAVFQDLNKSQKISLKTLRFIMAEYDKFMTLMKEHHIQAHKSNRYSGIAHQFDKLC